MPRLFIALCMPAEVGRELDALCVGLPAIRWTESEQFHLTLRFIGEVDNATFLEIGAGLASVTGAPFEMRLKGLGTFPPRGEPQTLWAGVETQEPLANLRARIERGLGDYGLEPERRRFTPHVTIGRFRGPPPRERFGSWLAARSLFRSSPFIVTSFTLFSSQLRPEGALHSREADYDFVTGTMERG